MQTCIVIAMLKYFKCTYSLHKFLCYYKVNGLILFYYCNYPISFPWNKLPSFPIFSKILKTQNVHLVQWFEYSSNTQEVAGSIPAQYKHLCAWTCLFVDRNNQTRYSGYFYVWHKCIYRKKYISRIYAHTPLTLYPQRGSEGISDIPLRRPRFTKIV
jgi:hypothetical protein